MRNDIEKSKRTSWDVPDNSIPLYDLPHHLPPLNVPAYHPPTLAKNDACLESKGQHRDNLGPYRQSTIGTCQCCPRPSNHSQTTIMSWLTVDGGKDGAETVRSCGGSTIGDGWHLTSVPSDTTCVPSSPPLEVSTSKDKRRAALAVFGGFVALFCTFGQMNSFGTFHSYYSRHQLQYLTPSKISWIGSLQLWVFFFSGGFIGRVFDSFGPTALMLAGSVCYALSVVATAFSVHYPHYMASQGLFFGLSVGLLFYPSMASVSTHFTKYRATALGLVAAGSSVGGVAYPIILQRLFESHGFRNGLLICGLSSSLACCISALTVTTARPPSSARGPTGKPRVKRPTKFFDPKSITDTRFSLLVVGSCFVALGLFTPFFYIVEYARHLPAAGGFNPYYVLAILNAGGILGRIAPAWLSDTFGHYNLLLPAAFLAGLSCVTLWLCARTLVLLLAFAAVYGFLSGGFVSLITPCVVRISDPSEIGTRIGMLYTMISIPSLVGGPIAGALLTYGHGSYSGTILFSGITVMLGSIFILGAKLAIDRQFLARV